ncbi:MAG: hypothetical protein RLZZ303_2158 [Candidatus Hydrogenedentota bacterium]|jgi:hypothetical protein
MTKVGQAMPIEALRLLTIILLAGGIFPGNSGAQEHPAGSLLEAQEEAQEVAATANTGDSRDAAPPSKQVEKQNDELFTTTDNQNNTGTGVPDGDMDAYLFDDDFGAPIEFDIAWFGAPAPTSPKLLINAFDVDESDGEVDGVFLNGTRLGTLTGANDEWSTTVLDIPPSLLVPGNNRVRITIDEATDGVWAVEVDWGQIALGGCLAGEAFIRSAAVDLRIYQPGDVVIGTMEIDTNLATQEVLVETNLIDPLDVNVAGTSTLRSLTGQANDPFSVALPLPRYAYDGTYTYQILVFDRASSRFLACQSLAFDVTSNVLPGNLVVTILPAEATGAGAQWKLDGGPFRNSGDLIEGVSVGTHTVSFKAVRGFATPGNQLVFIDANRTTRVTGNYTTQTGGVSVSLTPAAAVKAGAQWQVDDGPFKNNGTLSEGLAVGSHIVFFKTIEGFEPPPFQVVTVNPDEFTAVVGAYTPQTGSLTVELTPEGAVAAGAQWQVNGGPFRNSGATATGLPVGEHTLSFKNVQGFARPGNQSITIRGGRTTKATGKYSDAIGDLRVTLSPSGAVAAGAQWQVDGGELQNSGATVKGLSAGAHILSFKPVSGFPTPPDKTVVISQGQVTNATGEYALQNGGLTVTLTPASAVAAGAQWRVDDGPYQNSGTTVNRLTVVPHTISFKNIPGFETPDDQTITIIAGQANAATGAYRPLTGGLTVTLGPAAAVAAGAQWQVDGGPFQNSGATVPGLSEGPRLVRFKAVPGFDAPEDQSVDIVAGENASLNAAYGQDTGSISVTINPASAADAGARWRVDNGPEQVSGATLDGVPTGNRLVTFSPVPGFAAPAAQTVAISKGEVAFVTATYATSGACCAGGAQVKSIEEAIKHYLGDFTLFLAALATLVAMGRAGAWRLRG